MSTASSLRSVDDQRPRAGGFPTTGADEDPGRSAPRLGVGIAYDPALVELLRSDPGLVDYVAIVPERFWTDSGTQAAPRFAERASWVDTLDWFAARRPLVSHGIGLSLAGAEVADDTQYVEQLAAWNRRYAFPWRSDHLSFSRAPAGRSERPGLAAPLPFDSEVLDLVSDRVARHLKRLAPPFLIENGVYYLSFIDQDMSEAEFLNRLARRTGCGLLLDVPNLFANARTHEFDVTQFLDALDLTRVVEVLVAGGSEPAGGHTASPHSGSCLDTGWSVLEQVVANAPNLRGITFEFRGARPPSLQELRAQLDRARALWMKHRA